ncbi:unnamed protein product [Alopecurus aequalis]
MLSASPVSHLQSTLWSKSMADGGGVGDEGSGLAEWQPIYDRVEALVSKCQAHAVSLVADRARLGAADWVQRESWEAARRLQRSVEELQAAAREKEAEMDRLQAEAAIARKKLQADAGRKMRWEAAYVDLLLGANQKLAELRDGDMDDSRTCAETPNLTGVGSCTNLNQNDADHITIDLSGELRKLKQAYETLSSKKDKEVSALLSAKDSACNQLSIIQQNYAELLKKKEAEAAQATEATRTLQQNVDELKVLAQNKDDEIGRMRAEAIGVQNKLQKMQSLVKEKDDEIQRLKGRHPVSVQKRNKDISETHKRSRSDDPHVVVREPENNGLGQTIGDKIPETKAMENNWQDETTRKRRRASSMSNDDEKSGSNEDDAEQIESGEDGDKGSGSYVDGDEQSGNGENGDEQTGSGEDGDGDDDNEEQSGSDEETTHNQVQKPLRNTRRYYNSRKGGFSEVAVCSSVASTSSLGFPGGSLGWIGESWR